MNTVFPFPPLTNVILSEDRILFIMENVAPAVVNGIKTQ